MAIYVVIRNIAMHSIANQICHATNGMNVGGAIEEFTVFLAQPSAVEHLLKDRLERDVPKGNRGRGVSIWFAKNSHTYIVGTSGQ